MTTRDPSRARPSHTKHAVRNVAIGGALALITATTGAVADGRTLIRTAADARASDKTAQPVGIGELTSTTTPTPAAKPVLAHQSVSFGVLPPPTGIINGNFETGAFNPWNTTGTTSIANTAAYTGTYGARAGSTSPTLGDSTIAQTFLSSTGASTLSFRYKMFCPDLVANDWATATLKDNTTGTTVTPLVKTCANSSGWVNVSTSITPGHRYTLTLVNHDNNLAGKPTYTLFDDITLTSTLPPPAGIINGNFETSYTGWTVTGTTSLTMTAAHAGTYGARAGSTSPTAGDSTISQTFTAWTGVSRLSFWYKVSCPDLVANDWAMATLKDNTTGTTTTPLAKTCTNNGSWVNVTPSITAGRSYTLTLVNHDNNLAGKPTYTLFDDITLTNTLPPPGGIINGNFETGTYTGWTTTGTTSIANAVAMAGTSSPTAGDSTISQTFTTSAGAYGLSFWYKVSCPDLVNFDWAMATLKDNTTGTTTTPLAKTCTNNGSWVNVTTSITAGRSYTLTLVNHDDNHAGDATYTLFDNVAQV